MIIATPERMKGFNEMARKERGTGEGRAREKYSGWINEEDKSGG